MTKRLLSLFIVSSLVAGLSFVITNSPTASGVAASEWQAGNIIDDTLFYDGNAMSVVEIQNFLNSLVPTCDTWGTKPHESVLGKTRAQVGAQYGNPPPYICLKDYYENPTTKETNFNPSATIPPGAISAAQIIYDAAKTYGINPKGILVTIKKEAANNLMQDDWPWKGQYRSALGYGCPDTAACDSQYYGYYNQVRNSARQFRLYADYPDSYRRKAGVTQSIQYHPFNSCASPDVYIQNKATAGLYNYTPYQPNAAALANMPGTGDSCSSYGNRNFWYLWRSWFGSTHSYTWQPMDSSRWMQLKATVRKIDFSTGNEVDDPLLAGQHIKFIDKTTVDGVVYLRTQWDYSNNIPKGVPLSSLEDIAYDKINAEWMITNYDGVHKYIARQQKWVSVGNEKAKFPIGTIIKIVDSITINGQVSYRTEYDSNMDNDLSFTSDRLSPLKSVLTLEPPRDMQAKLNTVPKRINGDSCAGINKYDIVYLEGKAIINGALYFSNLKSSEDPNEFCFINPNDMYWGTISFANFEQPRYMKLKRDINRINAYTGETVDTLKAGHVIHFSTKTSIHNMAFFRTTYNSQRNEPFVISANDLSEI